MPWERWRLWETSLTSCFDIPRNEVIFSVNHEFNGVSGFMSCMKHEAKLRGHSHVTSTNFCNKMKIVAGRWFGEISRQSQVKETAVCDPCTRDNSLPCICKDFFLPPSHLSPNFHISFLIWL